ncbi:50S ribosomal protein L25 [Mediterraneibacter faecis]|uniref:50S ribosomal protein L25 n=1 Tax=Mediterraneibacter faecis TaxID=592978 RepID=UPI0022E9955F|nr:50S ribosomal protein L25 [Mediterraneibacter faecis]
MNTLKAEKRDMSIKAKKLRREGFVTGNLFGRELEDSIPLKFDKAEIEKLLKVESKGGQVMLEVAGETYDALIKEVDYNPLKGYVDEIDFQALVSNEKVHSVAEIHLVNLEKLSSGVPQQMLQEISFKALPAALVEKVEVDVGPLKIGDTIRVADLPIAKDKDVDLMTDLDATVVTITEVHVKASDLTSDEEEAAE